MCEEERKNIIGWHSFYRPPYLGIYGVTGETWYREFLETEGRRPTVEEIIRACEQRNQIPNAT